MKCNNMRFIRITRICAQIGLFSLEEAHFNLMYSAVSGSRINGLSDQRSSNSASTSVRSGAFALRLGFASFHFEN